ncbi:UvrD-helicase domain-containing protein [Leptospira biflexa]|uniref:UvrD-helicase domain-containing protein n=1 Tax=Leptospira biflexa TaxID=172 RepID=UPI00108319C5|nr:UvrD-helicase domain-containing protein [Leptospira biflexa]TGM31086.1 DNA helicase [Leptospira biflexa]TGM34576.1 DNA helicase [Leptospira biflexa]
MWSEEQSKIIHSTDPVIQVIAGAGSGKTATMIGLLERREKNETILPEETLVVTFTKKATHEFKERCQKKSLSNSYHISTFHSFCYDSLKQFDRNKNWKNYKLLGESKKWEITKYLLSPYKDLIGGIPFSVLLKKDGAYFKSISEEIYVSFRSSFHHWKGKNYYFEFDDLIQNFLEFLHSNHSSLVKKKWKSLIIDEFQDTDEIQLEIIKQMEFDRITVVGDDWQAIYGFRGATPKPFLEFPIHFPNAVQFKLSTNYRSTHKIIQKSLLPIHQNKEKIPKQTISHRHEKGFFHLERSIKKEPQLKSLWKQFQSLDPNLVILTRSNFRKAEWIQAGVPLSQVMTIHSAKGLEFKTVLVDLSKGWSEDQNLVDTEEERRILYVALSRAKDNLIVLINATSDPKSLCDRFSEDFSVWNRFRNRTLRWTRLW